MVCRSQLPHLPWSDPAHSADLPRHPHVTLAPHLPVLGTPSSAGPWGPRTAQWEWFLGEPSLVLTPIIKQDAGT